MHKNAEILMEIAKEAAVNAEYWKEFEIATYETTIWSVPASMFHLYQCLCEGTDIRRKPRTIRIGDIDVPEPVEVRQSAADSVVIWITCESESIATLTTKALLSLTQRKE